ncbi:GFA family protein [Shimia sp. FJ5]|uniref:GFA family protein n=1 Tax=Shimia sp. FJ5 TaxID=3079054 RepID=UPI00262ED570|nr:GFA family protein [Shimia sp. FJ5]MDV4143362.1 GFA family protein [Shimia sp. FJ5]
MENNPTTGQCLCGAVKFRIAGEFESFFLCHCTRCRKDSGSAHSANLFSSTAKITWVLGEEQIKTFQLSGSLHVKSFCSQCGSALPVSQPEIGLLVVPAGALDSQFDMRPNAHICCSSRANWDNDLASIEKIEGLPG